LQAWAAGERRQLLPLPPIQTLKIQPYEQKKMPVVRVADNQAQRHAHRRLRERDAGHHHE